MKNHCAWILYFALGSAGTWGADRFSRLVPESSTVEVASSERKIIERGSNQRVWQHTVTRRLQDGRTVSHTNSFVELAAGLHYWDGEKWADSRDEIEIVPDGAAATRGQHKVHFSGNLNTFGAIGLTMPDGKAVRSHVCALAYEDSASGQSVFIAQIQNSEGLLLPDNRVIYPGAFGVAADVRYTYSKGGFEQDILIRRALPSPREYGLDANTTQLTIWTEFLDAPEPVKQERKLRNGLVDQALNFGSMHMGRGTAFLLGAANERSPNVRVSKTWVGTPEGRRFLVEAIPYRAVEAELATLPPLRAALPNAAKNSRLAFLNSVPRPSVAEKARPMRMAAKIDWDPGQALVVDYAIFSSINGNYTFQADQTYYLSSYVFLNGVATFEGGAVLKYAPTNSASLELGQQPIVKTDRYRPVIFTARDDNSVGDTIPGSTGTPSGYYAATALYTGWYATPGYANFHFRYANCALHLEDMWGYSWSHCQFIHCNIAIDGGGSSSQMPLQNALLYDVNTAFSAPEGEQLQVIGQNVTINKCRDLTDGTGTLYLTNSLLVSVTNDGTFAIANGYTVRTNSTGVFQTVGAGAHYLADLSPYRDAGTTNIPAELAVELKKRTTYPPIVINPPGIFYGQSGTFTPQAQRDTDVFDLGYHYAPIDYAMGPVYLTNATITVSPGATVAFFNPSNASYYGLSLASGAKVYGDGRADAKVNFTHYVTVQELPGTSWAGPMYSLFYGWNYPSGSPEFRCRFTDFTVMGGVTPHLYALDGSVPWQMIDCQFHGGNMNNWGGCQVYFTNCLFNRTVQESYIWGSATNQFRNCTYYGGTFTCYVEEPQYGVMTDTLFVGTAISGNLANSRIAYTTNCSGGLDTTNTSDIIMSALAFETGWLGYFYVPTNAALINAGSRNATNAGLYHYTMLANQVKETNTTVDIGFHYVATDSNGTPLDYDGDGLPDYWEDTNGNGSADIGETSWLLFDTDGDGVGDGLEVLQGRNPRGGTTNDTSNLINLRIFTPLK